jgi:septal ring factor EnvC (AmiA/AmiB activator)
MPIQRNEAGEVINPDIFPDSRPITSEEAKQKLDQLLAELATVRTKQDEIVTRQSTLETKLDEQTTEIRTIRTNTTPRTPPP